MNRINRLRGENSKLRTVGQEMIGTYKGRKEDGRKIKEIIIKQKRKTGTDDVREERGVIKFA